MYNFLYPKIFFILFVCAKARYLTKSDFSAKTLKNAKIRV